MTKTSTKPTSGRISKATEDATHEICLRVRRNDAAWLKQHLADKLKALKHGQAFQIVRSTCSLYLPRSSDRDEIDKATSMTINELHNSDTNINETVDGKTMLSCALESNFHRTRDSLHQFGADVNISEGPASLPIALKQHGVDGSLTSLAFLYTHGVRVTQEQNAEFKKLATDALGTRNFTRIVLLAHIAAASRLDCPWLPMFIQSSLTSAKFPESDSLKEELAISFVKLLQKGHIRAATPNYATMLFKRAANLGFEQLMCALIQWRPQLLQAPWIRNKIPEKLAKKEDFVAWMCSHRTKPLSLQQLCKAAIRNNISHGMTEEKIEQLHGILPRQIVEELKNMREFTPWEGVQEWRDISELCPTE